MELGGKTALVTGAAHGIGRAIAEALAAEGCAVAVNYAHSETEAGEVAARLAASGAAAMAVRADVSREAEVRQMVDRVVAQFGGLDFLVNNAGIVQRVRFDDMSEGDWRRVLDVNLTGAFLCARAAAPALRAGGGRAIVNIASMRGIVDRGAVHYAVSKAGMIMLTRSLAHALAPAVRVNAVAPGYTETRLQENLTAEQRDQILAGIPLSRFARPEEVAAAVVFLLSERAAYITGQTLVMDGGVVMQ